MSDVQDENEPDGVENKAKTGRNRHSKHFGRLYNGGLIEQGQRDQRTKRRKQINEGGDGTSEKESRRK